jgi:O-antigen/teichoic acid export membrane protein
MPTRKSLFFSFLDRYASLVINVIASMIIARLLTPSEIGVFSVTMVLLMLVSTVRDMGAGQYLIQEQELTIKRIRAVWAVQLCLGLGLACIVLLASYPIAVFYNEPRMRNIMCVVALNYAVNPFGSLTYAWLMREMRFESIALMRFLSTLGGVLVSTWLAWQNYGPISLAFGSLASTVVSAIVAIYYRPKFFPWLPGFCEIKRVLAFGSHLTASTILHVIGAGAPELLLSKLQDITAAGLYSRSSGLVQMFYRLFVDAVASVCLPWFAKNASDKKNLHTPFLKATSYVTSFGWSFCLVVICLAHPMIRFLYGTQWDQSVDMTRLLAVAMAISVPTSLCQPVLVSSGAVAKVTRLAVISVLQGLIFAVIGASYSLLGLGVSLIFVAVVNTILWLTITSRHIGLPFSQLLQTFLQSAAVALFAAICPFFVLWLYGPYPDAFVMPLVLGGTGSLFGFILGTFIFKHPLQNEIKVFLLKITKKFK